MKNLKSFSKLDLPKNFQQITLLIMNFRSISEKHHKIVFIRGTRLQVNVYEMITNVTHFHLIVCITHKRYLDSWCVWWHHTLPLFLAIKKCPWEFSSCHLSSSIRRIRRLYFTLFWQWENLIKLHIVQTGKFSTFAFISQFNHLAVEYSGVFEVPSIQR